ncbi:MAG: PQQ-like beta-propeller repeat protein [Proteobacteria bacterium]|nr:PQQ-like beta-propeller repeat protein [Pseudomonadota bacterium]
MGEGGLVLRTTDGGASWTQESSGTRETLLAVTMPADWTMGVAVGASGTVVRRIPPWEPSILYDTEVASLAPPTVIPSATMSQRVAFTGNNSGWLYALSPTARVPRYSPARLADAVQGRSPVGPLPGDSYQTLYAATAAGLGYAVNATTGALRWTTDGDSSLAGNQPLGAALVAAPVVSPTRNLAFFATRNLSGAQNRLFAFDAKTGACRWVLNGSCAGATGVLNLGQLSGSPIHDATARKLFVTSTSLSGGSTVWAVDAGDATPGTVSWSRNLGDSDASPSFAETTRTSLYVGTNSGRLHRVRSSDGVSCWSTTGSGCTAFGGSEQAFCTATDALGTACAAGSAIASGVVVLWSGSHLGRLLFATADGHLRLLNADGSPGLEDRRPDPRRQPAAGHPRARQPLRRRHRRQAARAQPHHRRGAQHPDRRPRHGRGGQPDLRHAREHALRRFFQRCLVPLQSFTLEPAARPGGGVTAARCPRARVPATSLPAGRRPAGPRGARGSAGPPKLGRGRPHRAQ